LLKMARQAFSLAEPMRPWRAVQGCSRWRGWPDGPVSIGIEPGDGAGAATRVFKSSQPAAIDGFFGKLDRLLGGERIG
jgi:hypothetical protein